MYKVDPLTSDDLTTDEGGCLKTMFCDGKWLDVDTFEDIRIRLKS